MLMRLFYIFAILLFCLSSESQVLKCVDLTRTPREKQIETIYGRYPHLKEKISQLKSNWNGQTITQKKVNIEGEIIKISTIDFTSPEFVVLYRGIGRVTLKTFDPNYSIKQNGFEHAYASSDPAIAAGYARDGIIVKYLVPASVLSDGRFENAFVMKFDKAVDNMAPFITSIGTYDKKTKKFRLVPYPP